MSRLAAMLTALPEGQRREALAGLSAAELTALEFEWQVWARPDQLPPPAPAGAGAGAWRTWLLLGGRGSGKTRSSAEATRAEIESGRRVSIGLVGPTADTLRRD